MLQHFRLNSDPEKQLDDLVLELLKRFENEEVPPRILEAAIDLQTALREHRLRQAFGRD